MADSALNLGSIKSFIDKLFRDFGKFIDGYDVKDGKVTNKSGGVTSTITCEPDLTISLTATNVGKAKTLRSSLDTIDKIDSKFYPMRPLPIRYRKL